MGDQSYKRIGCVSIATAVDDGYGSNEREGQPPNDFDRNPSNQGDIFHRIKEEEEEDGNTHALNNHEQRHREEELLFLSQRFGAAYLLESKAESSGQQQGRLEKQTTTSISFGAEQSRQLMKIVDNTIKKDVFQDSALFGKDQDMTRAQDGIGFDIVALDASAIGECLGQGGFCTVHRYEESSAIKFLSTSLFVQSEDQMNTDHEDSFDDAEIVQMNKEKQQEKLRRGAIDLVTEAYMLSILDHPNIISLKGVTGLARDSKTGQRTARGVDQFVLVLEKVDTTLQSYLHPHREKLEETRSFGTSQSPVTTPSMKEWVQRFSWGLQLAEALAYLHNRRIVYRDLKCSNVGLARKNTRIDELLPLDALIPDERDDERPHQELSNEGETLEFFVKLLDFGLAKELKPSNAAASSDKYTLTGRAGSCQTWAPEVAKGWNYNEKVDVYSFAIVFWSILTGQEAFAGMTVDDHMRDVVNGNQRPHIPLAEWSSSYCSRYDEDRIQQQQPLTSPASTIVEDVADLLQQCWVFFPNARPSMSMVVERLKRVLKEAQADMRAQEQRLRQRQCFQRRILMVTFLLTLAMLVAFVFRLSYNATSHFNPINNSSSSSSN